jgi:hypothetical protein
VIEQGQVQARALRVVALAGPKRQLVEADQSGFGAEAFTGVAQ